MPEMKDSSIPDIGMIPASWRVPKIGFYFEFCSGDTLTSIDIDDNVGEYIVYGANGKRGYYSRFNTSGKHILLGRVGALCGNVHIIDGENWVTEHALILTRKKECNEEFCGYVFEMLNLGQYSKSSAQPVISVETISQLKFILPTIEEQKRIAIFLRDKCSEIDSLLADIQAEIDTLEEYKKSVIFETICHGLKANDSLKITSSDVWTEIPQNWELKNIKYLFEIVKRIAGKEGYDVLSVTQRGLKVKDITSGDGQLADSYAGYQFVYPTDYVMNHMDLLTGWVDLSSMFGVTSPDYRVFRLRDRNNNNLDYYKYVMQCCYLNKIFYSLGQGVSNLGRWRLQTSSFNNFKVPVPPIEEQIEIADYLNNVISETNSIIDTKKQQLETLEEYKKSVIYEYVTGKKEVPNA